MIYPDLEWSSRFVQQVIFVILFRVGGGRPYYIVYSLYTDGYNTNKKEICLK